MDSETYQWHPTLEQNCMGIEAKSVTGKLTYRRVSWHATRRRPLRRDFSTGDAECVGTFGRQGRRDTHESTEFIDSTAKISIASAND
jgi:hypothetical protein